MANRKISDLTALTAPAVGDLLPIVDISEALAADKNKRITLGTLLGGAPLGSAAAPTFAFSGDSNTGIYSPGADQLAISTNGTEKLIVKSDGKVGIGTTSPGYKLTVQSDSTNTVFSTPFNNYGLVVRNDDTTNNNYAALAFGTRSTAAADTSIAAIAALCTDHTSGSVDGELGFFTTGGNTISERARIDSSGRLLVGTSSDSGGALFQVNGDRIRVGTAKTPASASATGTAGEICWDANYIYVCTATNTWKRTAIATW